MKKIALITLLGLSGCMSAPKPPPFIPARAFSDSLKVQRAPFSSANTAKLEGIQGSRVDVPQDARARVQLVSESAAEAPVAALPPADSAPTGEVIDFRQDRAALTRPYQGPLALGEPGVTSSLWRESRSGNDLFRDYRAFQPMDLLTIVVDEEAEGRKAADTEIKQKSTVAAALENLFGLETRLKKTNYGKDFTPTLSDLISASSQNDFKGEGRTNRRDSLTARISSVVVEVLPSGVLRVEGQKIISVNSEEQIMVISGLVRPQDVNSTNEVESSKIAQMRIDYYGSGTVDEAQHGGWLARFFRIAWPF